LGGILKDAAKKALPVIGGSVGGYFGGSRGADIGGRIGSAAGSLMGLEFEGTGREGLEFETARQFVRFGGAATVGAARSQAGAGPDLAAKQAAVASARKYLPALMGGYSPTQDIRQAYSGTARSGRWYRRGRKIVLVGI
jgi:hypothetical protein